MSEKYYISGIVLAVIGLVVCFDGLKSVRGQTFETAKPAEPTLDAGLAEPVSGDQFKPNLQPENNFNELAEPEGATPYSKAETYPQAGPGTMQRGIAGAVRVRRNSAEKQKLQNQIREAVKKIQEVKEPEAKHEVITEMKELFTKYFDQEIQQREEKLAPLENQVKKLRDQIEKRKAAKADIIELQLKLIEHQAEGLGFFTEPNNSQGTASPFGVTAPLPSPVESPALGRPANLDWDDTYESAQPSNNRRSRKAREKENGEEFDVFN